MEQAQLLNELSEVGERISEHRLDAQVTFKCFEDGDIAVTFTHFHNDYPQRNSSINLYTFYNEDELRAWHYQLDKVFEGGLLDEI